MENLGDRMFLTPELAKKELAWREQTRRRIKKDDFFFVENFIWIENKENTASSNKVLFKLWPRQKEAWKEIDENKKTVVPKARQIGITWLALAKSIKYMLDIEGFDTIIISQTDDYAKEAVERVDFMLDNLPNWLCQKANKDNLLIEDIYLFESTKSTVTIWHPLQKNKPREKSTFKSKPSTKGAGRSLTADFVIFDEWAMHQDAVSVFSAAYPTINRVGGGKFLGISTNLRGTFFEEIISDPVSKGFHLIFISVWADPKRTAKWYEETKRTMPNTWMQEYPETIEQCMSAGERTAFPQFSRSIHVCETFEPPEHWPRWMGVDNGYNDPFAWYKFAVNEDGIVFMYYEYTRRKGDKFQVGYSDQAAKVAADCTWTEWDNYQGCEVERKEKIQYCAIGKDAWNTHHRDESGKSLIDYYHEGGFNYPFVKPITDRRARYATFTEYFKPFTIEVTDADGNKKMIQTAKLQIMDCCDEFIRTIPLLVKEENDSEVVEDDSKIDNCYDGAGYGLITHHRKKSKPEEKPQDQGTMYKKKLLTKGRSRKRGVLN